MKKILLGALLAFSAHPVFAEEVYPVTGGAYIIPDSSIRNPADTGITEHTFNILFKPDVQTAPSNNCETPASLACVYGLTTPTPGCPISTTTINPSGGAGTTIAIVDAYNNSDQAADLATYSTQFNLPAPTLTVYNGATCSSDPGGLPPDDTHWADEHTLDLQMVHAMAPYAAIDMVEAISDSNGDLINAENCATTLITAAGGGIVSNSWGGDEYPEETTRDVHFQNDGVVYVFSSGDYSAPARYPSSSPYVISAGGTSILRDAQGNFIGEGAWSTEPGVPIGEKSGGSGGPSAYEPRPYFQRFVQKIVETARGTPDIAFDADPATGVCIYSTVRGGWLRDGGTSVAAPALSGILDTASYKATSSQDMLNYIYSRAVKNYHSYWHDGIIGNNGHPAMAGYDFVTGLGSPHGYEGK